MSYDYTKMEIDIELRKDFNLEDYTLNDVFNYSEELKSKKGVYLNEKYYRIREVRVSEKRYNYAAVIIFLYPDNNIEIKF